MTGMRRGEILGLRWRDVDLDAARLSVRQAVVAVEYEVIESTPKSHNARVIDLDGETVGLLRAHKQRQRAERLEWGADYGDRDLVATHANGSPIHPPSFSEMFTQLVNRAGIRPIRLHEYADVRVMPMLLRRCCSGGFLSVRGRHNQSASRNARSVSVGR